MADSCEHKGQSIVPGSSCLCHVGRFMLVIETSRPFVAVAQLANRRLPFDVPCTTLPLKH